MSKTELTPGLVGSVIAVETNTQYVVGRLAGYERDPGDHAMTLWFEHGPQVRVTRNADIVQWYIPKQVEVTGTGYNNAVVTQEQS